jgi:uncharacterized tellurite resistance protein B-like protein
MVTTVFRVICWLPLMEIVRSCRLWFGRPDTCKDGVIRELAPADWVEMGEFDNNTSLCGKMARAQKKVGHARLPDLMDTEHDDAIPGAGRRGARERFGVAPGMSRAAIVGRAHGLRVAAGSASRSLVACFVGSVRSGEGMIAKLRRLIRKHLGPGEGARGAEVLELRLATATLLMEAARADSGITEQERRVVRRLIETHFALAPAVTRDIAASAENESRRATSLYPFTHLINSECSPNEKARIIGMLWRVSCADGHVDKYEEHLVRKVAELLHVPHRDFIRMKLRVLDEHAAEKPPSSRGDAPATDQGE